MVKVASSPSPLLPDVGMSQSSIMVAALIGGFVIYLAMAGKLGVYWSMLTGGGAQAASTASAASTSTTSAGVAASTGATTTSTASTGSSVTTPSTSSTSPTTSATSNSILGVPIPSVGFGGLA